MKEMMKREERDTSHTGRFGHEPVCVKSVQSAPVNENGARRGVGRGEEGREVGR